MSKEKINLDFDDTYRELRDRMEKKYFDKEGKRSVGLFALALGIKLDQRIPRSKWKGQPISWTDMDRLRGQDIDFGILFDYMGIDVSDGVPYVIEEFLTGGFKYIEDNALDEDGNLCEISLN